jgi:Ala-tRNA(Pro) deacylase
MVEPNPKNNRSTFKSIISGAFMHSKQELLDYLATLNIQTTCYFHEPLFTCEQARKVVQELSIPGAECKNLFLKDDNKKYYLVVALADTKIELKKLAQTLNAPKLRFANSDELKQYLGVEPGSVTPFGLINDTAHIIQIILDAQLFAYDLLGFHPLRNDATLTITPSDLQKFISACQNITVKLDFSDTKG